MTMPDYGSKVFAGWRTAAGEHWRNYTDHMFVRELADGTLPRPAFMAYLIQDYIFLMNYSRAWAMAVIKSETPGQMRTSAAMVNALINEEIKLHISICKREGISEQMLGGAREEAENLAYTRYVMDAGLSGDLLDLLATLAPCVFGYGEIGKNLKNSTETTVLYREWIDTYHGEEYQSVCIAVAELIDQVAQSKIGPKYKASPRWTDLCQRFETATRLETDFWSMGLRLGKQTLQ